MLTYLRNFTGNSIVILFLGFVSFGALLISEAPYQILKIWVDSLAGDGTAASFSIWKYKKIVTILTGVYSIGLAGVFGLLCYQRMFPAQAIKSNPWIATYLTILLLPFFTLYWLVPIFSNLTIGNDYSGYSLNQQLELMFSIKHSTFPLFVPGFEGGHSSAALTLGQIWHPIARLAEVSPGYWNGHALDWGTFYRLTSLGVAHLLLFRLLRLLKIPIIIAFLLSFITVYNFRMLDQFRYGAGLEAYTGCVFLIVASGYRYLKGTGTAGIAWIVMATYWLITSGHPQFMYLCLITALLFAILFPFVVSALHDRHVLSVNSYLRYLSSTGAGVLIGIGLSSCYWMPFLVEVLGANSQRVGQTYQWSLAYSESFLGLLNSIFFPLASDVHSNFGGSSLILLSVTCVVCVFKGRHIPLVIWLMWGILILVFLVSLGDFTFLHYIYWKIFPFADSQRVPGRISVLLPPVIMLILVWFFQPSVCPTTTKSTNTNERRYLIVPLISFFLFISYFFFAVEGLSTTGKFTPLQINGPLSPRNIYLILLLGAVTLVLLPIYSERLRGWGKLRSNKILLRFFGLGICVLVIAHVSLQLRHGTWVMWPNSVVTFDEIKEEKYKKVDYLFQLPSSLTYGLKSREVVKFEKFVSKNPPLAEFFSCEIKVGTQDLAYQMLGSQIGQHCAVLEEREGNRASIIPNFPEKKRAQISLSFNTFNRYDFSVSAPVSGWFVLGAPFSEGKWTALVDQANTATRKVNGNLVGVNLGPGVHLVSFIFGSRATVYGFLCSGIFGIVLAFLVIRQGFRERWLGIGSKSIIIATLVIQWLVLFSSYQSFEVGRSLETNFISPNLMSESGVDS
jgi:hypothetical protein